MSADIVAADQLKSIVQRVERLEAEIADLNADKSEIYKEARANGFDVKVIKKVVSKRKLDEHERVEQDHVFDIYWDAVHGLNLVHAHARENIEEFDAETGEILDNNQASGGSHTAPSSLTTREPGESVVPHSPETATEVRSASTDAPETPGKQCTSVVSKDEAGQNLTGNHSPDQPLTGGDHEVGVSRETLVTGEGTACALPAKSSLRPLCRNPGDTCGGYGRKHCRACERAAAELEAAE